MKLFVLCDERGNVESVAIPNPRQAANVGVVPDAHQSVVELDADEKVIDRQDLLGENGEKARRRAYKRLRRLMTDR